MKTGLWMFHFHEINEERVIRIYPNEASVLRLLGAILMEQNEK